MLHQGTEETLHIMLPNERKEARTAQIPCDTFFTNKQNTLILIVPNVLNYSVISKY